MGRSVLVVGVLTLVPALVACGESSDEANDAAAVVTTTEANGRAGALADQYGVRYCEMLTVTLADTGTTAEVWGTQGLNSCPQSEFAAIDTAAVRSELGVTAAVPNGP